MVVTAVFLLVAVVAFGLLFLRLHSLPERMAHRGHKLQLEIIAVLCLIALFTHIHAFWIAALLLALIDLPDVGAWMGRIAGGVERIAANNSIEISTQPSPEGRLGEAEPSDRAGYTVPGQPSVDQRAGQSTGARGHTRRANFDSTHPHSSEEKATP